MSNLTRWGLYGDCEQPKTLIRVKDLVPGMWFNTDNEMSAFMATRKLCRENNEKYVKFDVYAQGKLMENCSGNYSGADLDRIACYMLDEQPISVVKKLGVIADAFS